MIPTIRRSLTVACFYKWAKFSKYSNHWFLAFILPGPELCCGRLGIRHHCPPPPPPPVQAMVVWGSVVGIKGHLPATCGSVFSESQSSCVTQQIEAVIVYVLCIRRLLEVCMYMYIHTCVRYGVIYSGAPLLWTPWGPGEVSCIQWSPSIVDTLGTW